MLKDLEYLLSGFDQEIDGLRAVAAAVSSAKAGAVAAIPEKSGQDRKSPEGLLEQQEDDVSPFEVLASVLQDQSAKLDSLIKVQKATLAALTARKKLIFDDDGRPVGAEIDRGTA